MGEGGGAEEKGRPDTKPFSKSCDTTKIWVWQWLDNTQYPLTSPTTRTIGKKPLTFFIDALISCYRYVILLWTEEFKKALKWGSCVLSWNENKTRARIVSWRPRTKKERCSWSMEKASYTSFCWNCLSIWVMVSQDRDKEDDISTSDIWLLIYNILPLQGCCLCK